MKKDINDLNEFNMEEKIKVHNEPFNVFVWLLKVEGIILLIALALIIIYLIIPNKFKFYIKYRIDKMFIKNNFNSSYIDSEFNNYLEKNKNLPENEKQFIKKYLSDELKENEKYIDFKSIKRKALGLKIRKINFDDNNKYSRKLEFKYNDVIDEEVAGDYSPIYNEVILYDFPKYDGVIPVQKGIFLHELNHLLTTYTIGSASNSFCNKLENSNVKLSLFKFFNYDYILIHKNMLTETINETFTREYLGAKDNIKLGLKSTPSYNKSMSANYMLMEILSEESVKKFKFQDNIAILIDDLLSINNNFDEVYNLFNSINKLNTNYKVLSDEEIKQCNKNIYNSLKYFYKAKFSKDMDNDLNMLCYGMSSFYKDSEKLNKVYNEFLNLDMAKGDRICDIYPKGYVSNEYKKSNPFVEICYIKDGIENKINIENRFIK